MERSRTSHNNYLSLRLVKDYFITEIGLHYKHPLKNAQYFCYAKYKEKKLKEEKHTWRRITAGDYKHMRNKSGGKAQY